MHAAVRSFIGEMVNEASDVTLLDMEASIEHLSRGTVRHVDALLAVVEPYYRSMETAGRIAPLARGLGINRVFAVANKLRDREEEDAVESYCSRRELELVARIPFDENALRADLQGSTLIDRDGDSPAVREIGKLADFLSRNITMN